MSDLLAARSQMAETLAFHIIFAFIWIAMPGLMALAERRWQRTLDPTAALGAPAAFPPTFPMPLAAYAATGLGVAGIHAFMLPRNRTSAFHRAGLTIGLVVGAPAAVFQPISGDIAARYVARRQPAKLAAMEALYDTRAGAPITIGPGIKIPYALSLLAFHDPRAVVQGLDAVPRDEWPNVPLVHAAFDLMVVLGTYMALVGLWAGWLPWRKGA